MGDVTPLLDSTATTRQVSVDRLSSYDGGSPAGSEEVQAVKPLWGAKADANNPSVATPFPIRDYGFNGSLITAAGGGSPLDSFSASTTIVTANSSRHGIIISNGGTVGIWLTFAASAAVVGHGVYLPPGSNESFPFKTEIRCIPVTGSAGPVGYVEF